MKKYINIALCAFLSALIGISCNTRAQNSETQLSKKDNETPKVYMFKEISSENLVKIYEALNRKATGKVAVKLSTGEPGGHNFLQLPEKHGYILPGKPKGTRGKTCLHKTISWSRWPKPPNRWLNIAVRKSFI